MNLFFYALFFFEMLTLYDVLEMCSDEKKMEGWRVRGIYITSNSDVIAEVCGWYYYHQTLRSETALLV